MFNHKIYIPHMSSQTSCISTKAEATSSASSAIGGKREEKEGQEEEEEQEQEATPMPLQSLPKLTNYGKNPSKKASKPKKEKIITLVALICSILAVTFVFIGYHTEEKKPEIVDSLNIQQEPSTSNDSCSFWHITGDDYCDDEANIVECGYDFDDCCQIDSDRSLCTDCICYIPEEEKILLDEKYSKNCQNSHVNIWGDGFCDILENNKDNYFDVGDCCLENPICLSTTWQTKADLCPENPCIQSNIFCILDELGDGMCQDYNNGPFCQYDLGDCCLVPEHEMDCECNCNCKPLDTMTLG